jgi:hypothetical protein
MNLTDLRLRVRALFTPAKVERELDDELAFDIECETRKLMAGGLPAAEARRRALARFGPVPLAEDRCREERGISFFETLARDVGYALRTSPSLLQRVLVPGRRGMESGRAHSPSPAQITLAIRCASSCAHTGAAIARPTTLTSRVSRARNSGFPTRRPSRSLR